MPPAKFRAGLIIDKCDGGRWMDECEQAIVHEVYREEERRR